MPDVHEGQDIHAAGYVITGQTAESLGRWNLDSLTIAPAPRVLLVDRDDLSVDPALGNRLEMLGSRVRVKSGIARLAARFGCPLLPVVVPRVGGSGRFRIGRAVTPGGRLKGPAEERFVREAMAHLYGTFERGIRERPAQWETGCFFHRWRAGAEATPPLPAPSLEAARREVEADLAAGRRLGMNAHRIVEIRSAAETIWSDARTLKAYRAPAAAPWLLDGLSPSGGGLDRQQLAERATSSLPTALSFLALLKARGALTANWTPGGPPGGPPDVCHTATAKEES